MPSPPVVPGGVRVIYEHIVGADATAQVSWYFLYTGGPPTSAQLSAWCTSAAAQWATNIQPLQGSSVEMIKVTAIDLSSVSAAEGFANAALTGTRPGAELPAGTAALINFQIARRYRGGKPRVYLPAGVTTDLGSPQVWTVGFKSAVDSGIASYFTWAAANPPAGVSAWSHVNVSLFQGVNPPTTLPSGRVKQTSKYRATALTDPVLSATLNIKVASQRRRNLH